MRNFLRATMVALAALAFAPSPLLAQSAAPSFDCKKAASAVEKLICANKGLSQLDRETTQLFTTARDNAGDARIGVIESQRRWVQARNDCATSTDKDRCLVESYVGRISDLRRQFAAARQVKGSVSLGPFVAQCDRGDPLSVAFVNTDPSYVFIGTAKTAFVLQQAISGSGARYEAQYPKGQARLWNKGDDATIALPGERDMNCTLKLTTQVPN